MPTEAGVSVTDQATGAKIPIDGIVVPAAGANPTTGQALRQGFALGSGDGSANFGLVDSTGNVYVNLKQNGFANFVPTQLTLTSATAALIVAARTGLPGTGRGLITIVNMSTTSFSIGGSGVTYGGGFIMPGVVGATITIPTTAAIYGALQAAGSALICAYELY